ncbi:MAG: virginiamycin B lyase family protein, partial [Gammaproteobacteria bacterium]
MHSLIPRILEIALVAAIGLPQLWAGAAAAEPHGRRDVESFSPIIEYVIPRAGAAPYAVAVNRFGVAWYVDQANSRIGRVDPETGQIKDFEMPSPGAAPHGIAIGRRGIWYTATKLGRIGVLDIESGKIMEYPLPLGAKDPDTLLIHKNRIWFTAQRANACGYLDPRTGAVIVLPVITPNARPHDLAVAP